MSSFLHTGLQTALGCLQPAAGTTVTYRRGTASHADLPGWFGRLDVASELGQQSYTTHEASAFHILQADYEDLFETLPFPPLSGDLIIDSAGRRYEVLPTGDRMDCYDWLGAERQALRLHLKLIQDV